MKIKTLAVIGLLALAPVQTVELNAATNTTVKVAKDDSGKVDYKNFYKNGSRVKYEDWNKGKKVKVTNYKNGKVSSKTYYTNGVKTKFEKWSNGRVVQRTAYQAGKVTSKSYYKNGVKTGFQRWNNGKVTTSYLYENGKCVSKEVYTNGKFKHVTYYDSKGNATYRLEYGNVKGAADTIAWYPSGQIKSTDKWVRSSYRVIKTFNKEGVLIEKEVYDYITREKSVSTYKNGSIYQTTTSKFTP